MVVGTGEDLPRGQSLRARTVVVEVAPGDVALDRLTAAQDDSRRGRFAQATAGFVRWLAPRLDRLQDEAPRRLAELRADARRSGMHARTPEAVAHLAFGWELWLAFARDVGALNDAEAEVAWRRAWAALGEVAARQPGHQAGEEPTQRFRDLLSSAIASGAAHVADPGGG